MRFSSKRLDGLRQACCTRDWLIAIRVTLRFYDELESRFIRLFFGYRPECYDVGQNTKDKPCHSRAGGNPYDVPYGAVLWIPACAGMTVVICYPHESLMDLKAFQPAA
jgi:hypothetical protein